MTAGTFRSLLTLPVAMCFAFASVSLPARPARACSCAWYDVAQAREQATHVFEGVLVRALPASGTTPERAELRVARVWKGAVTRTFVVQATLGLTMCPPHFEVGERYILYTSGPADAPRVSSCARYATGAQLATERAALGRPLQTFPARP
ncbi:MAG: hypothetical protein KC593_13030 [Myxococcales bacterium]|nr:hypothetical protein [Myxococcales bacterium]MCB9629797.1 hypothetical protein [Sandaracinaceae bacterium]